MRRFRVLAVAVLLAVGFLGAAPPSSAAAPGDTGCAAGYDYLSVEALVAAGYRVPVEIDRTGNADGFVCGRPLPDAACRAHGFDPCPVETYYLFGDNDVPGRS
jgi:hypothetical protein